MKKIEDYLKLPYTVELKKEEDGSYFVSIKELPGCFSVGDTIHEAIEMIEDAKKYEEEDKKKREAVDKKIAIESNIYSTKKLMEEFKDKIPEELKDEIENYVETIEQGLESNNMQLVEETNESLQEALKKIGEHLYSQEADNSEVPEETEVTVEDEPVQSS